MACTAPGRLGSPSLGSEQGHSPARVRLERVGFEYWLPCDLVLVPSALWAWMAVLPPPAHMVPAETALAAVAPGPCRAIAVWLGLTGRGRGLVSPSSWGRLWRAAVESTGSGAKLHGFKSLLCHFLIVDFQQVIEHLSVSISPSVKCGAGG